MIFVIYSAMTAETVKWTSFLLKFEYVLIVYSVYYVLLKLE